MNNETIIISAFPACGKSHAFNNQDSYHTSILDSDSSEFSWIKDSEGNNTKERNPDFPLNYIEHIKGNLGKVDYIFVSSHADVVQALDSAGIDFMAVMPMSSSKEEWLSRCIERGSPEAFVKLLDTNWDSWTNPANLKGLGHLQEIVLLPDHGSISTYLFGKESF